MAKVEKIEVQPEFVLTLSKDEAILIRTLVGSTTTEDGSAASAKAYRIASHLFHVLKNAGVSKSKEYEMARCLIRECD